MHRVRTRAIVTCLALVAPMLALAAAPAGAQTTLSVSASTVGEDQDFATTSYGDPWDFSNAEDHNVAPGARSYDITNISMSGGMLHYDSPAEGKLMLLDSWSGGGLTWGRDGEVTPIDADRYRYLSFRMRSTVSAESQGQIVWLSCGKLIAGCLGGTSFRIQPGWHTYHVRLDTAPRFGPNAWGGLEQGLLLQTDVATHVDLDWIRLHTSLNDVTVTVTGGSGVTVGWDTDTNPANNTATSAGWGLLPPPVNGRTTMSTGGFPPGVYHLTTTTNGTTTYTGRTVTVDARPAPVVIDPDRGGGTDYATAVRGDPWDFTSMSDVDLNRNVNLSIQNGQLVGTNAGPVVGDPWFFVPLATPIDTSRWHRVTLEIWYEGLFGLHAGPGGGMNARLLWRHADTGQFSTSEDIVVYPGWNTIVVDLRTFPASAATEGGTGRGWTGTVDMLRIDPHEDSAIRSFRVESVRLAEDDQAPGSFDIRFRDAAWEPGTTASIYADTDGTGFDGTLIGTVDVVNGVNVFRWLPGQNHVGTRWIHVTLRDPSGQTSSSYASGPVQVQQAAGTPFGNIDAVTAGPGTISVSGWTIDPDAGPIPVHVYVDGQFARGTRANLPRGDVGAAFPTAGPDHGFAATFPATPGTHQVCIHALNANVGTNTLLGCRSVTVSGSPFGTIDAVTPGPGSIAVSGWTVDPDAGSIWTHVYLDGQFVRATLADRPRGDVGAAFPTAGSDRGYATAFPAAAGDHTVCVHAINANAGTNTLLGCRVVTVSGTPFGNIDAVTAGPGTISVSGWTIDPDAGPIPVHVYVDGQFARGTRANLPRGDVGAAFPTAGPDHGFAATFPATPGTHQVCIHALNANAGTNTLLGCRSVTVTATA